MRRRAQGLAATVMLIGTLTAAGPASAYTVYISNEKGNSITVLDSATLEIKQTIPVGQRPRGIILTKDGKYLLVCASDDDTVQILDVATREIVGDLPSGPDPEQLRRSGGAGRPRPTASARRERATRSWPAPRRRARAP